MGVVPHPTALPAQLRTYPIVMATPISRPASLPVASASMAPLATVEGTIPATAVSTTVTATAGLPTPSIPPGLFMGDSTIPIPPKLVSKIRKLEFIEMHELLPENWPDLTTEEESKYYATFGKKKPPPVTNILTWVECYASLASVLATTYPTFIPEFMAYLSTIVKCHRRYEGLGWFSYDRAFRRQAANTKNLQWSKTDSTLFSLAFTGKAKQVATCEMCFSTNHTTRQCPDVMQFSPFQPMVPWVNPYPPPRPQPPEFATPAQAPRICGLFNSKKGPSCTYGSKCKYAHICLSCKGNHPRPECPRPKRQRPF